MNMTPPKSAYKRGDVILVLFPHSDLRTAKPRPALIVQADNLQTGLPQVIVAMVNSKLFRASHPSRVTVLLSTPEGQQSGLLTDSVVMTDNLATIAESEIDHVIGRLPMTELMRPCGIRWACKRMGRRLL
jgi:mRNA interferase MazF